MCFNFKKCGYLLLLPVLLAWYSCNIINPAEQIPTYIHIDSFTFNPNGAAAATHQITNVWVYYNNNPIGAFDLPATVPVITSGSSGTVQLAPGIVVDGLSSMTETYPFYQPESFTLTPQPGKTIVHEPVTQFYSGVKITEISYFKTGTKFGIWEGEGRTPMYIVPKDSLTLDGTTHEGCISLNGGSGGDSVVDSSWISFPVTTTGSQSFIELDYKCTMPFALGLQASLSGIYSTPYYLAGIYPSDKWQKFYFSVQDFAAQYKATAYNLYIRAVIPAGQTGKIYLANIQLVSF